MILETTATTLTLVSLKKITTHLTTKLLEKNWSQETESAKELIFQLSENDATHTYVEKYVSRFLKMRTLHSAESDVYLDEIYSPLTLTVQSNDDELCVNDGFTLSFRKVINIIGLAGQGKSTILRKLFLEEMKYHKGHTQGITKQKLIQKTLGFNIEELTLLQRHAVQETVSAALSHIRMKTECFIVRGTNDENDNVYFVLKNRSELTRYLNQKDATIKGQLHAKKRAQKALAEKWYNLKWQTE